MTFTSIIAMALLSIPQQREGINGIPTQPKLISELSTEKQAKFRDDLAMATALNTSGNGVESQRMLARWASFIDSEAVLEEEFFKSLILSGKDEYRTWLTEIRQRSQKPRKDGSNFDLNFQIKWLYAVSMAGGDGLELHQTFNWNGVAENRFLDDTRIGTKYLVCYDPATIADSNEMKNINVFHRNAVVSLCFAYRHDPRIQIAALRSSERYKNIWGNDQVLNLLAGRANEDLNLLEEAKRYFRVAQKGADAAFTSEAKQALRRLGEN